MKITFVLPYAGLAGGIKVAAIYADRLARRGHEIFLVSVPRRRVTLFDRGRAVLKGRPLPKRRARQGKSHLDQFALDWRVLERRRPVSDADVPDADVVVATWWETAEWVARLSESKGAKAYFIQHHEVHDNQPKDRVAATWRLPLEKITISRWLSEVNQREYGLQPIPVIHNSVDMHQFNAPERSRNKTPTVGLLYSDKYWKGVDVSFRAIEIARARFPRLRMIMFGAQGESPKLPLPPGAELIVQPPQEEIRDIYRRCDLWLCGSYAEGFHLPPLEAMACRVPVVSTEVGGPMDIVEEGVNGFLAPAGDHEQLGKKLLQALALPAEQWKRMSDAAYRTAVDYSWDDATDLFETELQRIADGVTIGS